MMKHEMSLREALDANACTPEQLERAIDDSSKMMRIDTAISIGLNACKQAIGNAVRITGQGKRAELGAAAASNLLASRAPGGISTVDKNDVALACDIGLMLVDRMFELVADSPETTAPPVRNPKD